MSKKRRKFNFELVPTAGRYLGKAALNMRSDKNCLRLDLLDCEDVLLCCSGGTDLVFFGLSGYT